MSVESEEGLRIFLKKVLLDPQANLVVMKTLSEMLIDDRVPILMELAKVSNITFSHWGNKLREFTCQKK